MAVIVTHPGQAHRDEFLTCCILLAAESATRIYRRDPRPEEFDDPEVFVVDQGERHEPHLRNFDHHQLPRDAAPTCSISLILPYLGLDVEIARGVWPWLAFAEALDSKGPFATATLFGMTPDSLMATISPVENCVLRHFEQHNAISLGSPITVLMRMIGRELLDQYRDTTTRLELLAEVAEWWKDPRWSFTVGDFRGIAAADRPTFGLELFLKGQRDDCPVTITNDDRGPGCCLFRRNDDPRVDFSRLEGMPGVIFAHKGGFVAKTKPAVDIAALIAAAVVVSEEEKESQVSVGQSD